jgi:hypothetical protein
VNAFSPEDLFKNIHSSNTCKSWKSEMTKAHCSLEAVLVCWAFIQELSESSPQGQEVNVMRQKGRETAVKTKPQQIPWELWGWDCTLGWEAKTSWPYINQSWIWLSQPRFVTLGKAALLRLQSRGNCSSILKRETGHGKITE